MSIDGTISPPNGRPMLTRPLTAMQLRVVRLCALGCTNKKIARVLNLSPSTVDNHKSRAMSKIGATNAALLTRYAIQAGIAPVGDQLTAEELAKLASDPSLSANSNGEVQSFRQLVNG